LKSRLKISTIVILSVFLVFVGLIISIFVHDTLVFRGYKLKILGFENEIANILLPIGTEKIAIKSAIGDSGGNGEYFTLRVVLVVKTDLNKNELEATINKIASHFLEENRLFFEITHCENSIFRSPVEFILEFDELLGISDYSNYFFIEFIE